MPFVSTERTNFDSDANVYRFTVQENSPAGTVIGQIRFDGGGDGTVFYTLLGPDSGKFSLGLDGTLTLRSGVELDFETGDGAPTLQIDISAIFFASDGNVIYGETGGSTVSVTNVNEAPSLSVTGTQSLELREGSDSTRAETGFEVSATDPDAGDVVTYTVSDKRFEVADGKLQVKAGQTFNYEAEPTVSVTVTATDRDGLSSSEIVSISITDVNERPFLALRGTQTLALREGQSSSAVTGIQVIAADPDKDDLTFTLSDDRFEIRDRQIAVKEGKDFDFETEPSITLEVTASDPDGLSHSQSVTITVTNVNEPPSLTLTGSQSLQLDEGNSISADTGIKVAVTDPDVGDEISFEVSDARFEVVDGKLRVKAGQTFDFESESKVDLTIIARDSNGLTDEATTTINISDVNEAPNISVDGAQTLTLEESESVASGDTGFTVSATDPDLGDSVTFSVDDNRFEIRDGKLRVKANQSFDFETESSIDLTVTATDRDGLTDTQSVTVRIENVNEAPSVATGGAQTLTLLEGVSIAADTGFTVTATDPDSGDAVTYSLSDARFEVVDGVLRVKEGESFDFESQASIDLTITGTDKGGLSDSKTVTVAVTDVNEAPTVTVSGSQTLILTEGDSLTGGNTGFTIGATDPDAGDAVTFSVDDDRFEVTDGKLRVKDGQSFDFETESEISVAITGTDSGGLTHSQTVTVSVTDRPEGPRIAISGSQKLKLEEGDGVAGGDTGFTVSATDGDGDDVTLSLSDDRFEIVGGKLRVKGGQSFDYETEKEIQVTITGTDPSELSHSQIATIAVTNVNEPPYLVDDSGDPLPAPSVEVVENRPGATVLKLDARDPEGDAPIRFFIRSNGAKFEIRDNVLKLRDSVSLDYETSDGPETVDIVMLTTPSGRPSFETVQVTVNVTNVNEAPTLSVVGSQTLDLAEGYSDAADTGFTFSATDPDKGDSVNISVSDDRFEIVDGKLRVKADKSFDYETEPSVNLTVTATDKGGLTDTQSITITVTDVEQEGNQPPTLSISGSQTLMLNEGSSAAGDTGFTISANDPNRDEISLETSDKRFEIVGGTLRVKEGQDFDFETEPNIELTVTASDPDGLTDTKTVTITVTDVNEAPTVSLGGSQTFDLNEGTSVAGDTGITVNATDPDADDSVKFTVDDDRFEIAEGKLRVKAGQNFDFEAEPTVDLTITGTDQAGLTGTQTVTIDISNVNEAPTVAVDGSQSLRLNEGVSVNGVTGFTVSTTDPDAGDEVTLSVSDDRFEITGGKLRVKARQSFDFEAEPTIELTITGTDRGGLTDTQTVTVNISNVNEAPTITTSGSQTLTLNEGTSVAGDTGITVGATDPDAGDSVTLSVSDERFEIVDGSLKVKSGQSFDFETEPKVDLTITGTDKGGLTDSKTVKVKVSNVNEPPTVSATKSQSVILKEGISAAADTGIVISSSDPDAGDSVVYSVDDDRFEVKGGRLHVKAGKSFDFETEPSVDLTITGTDQGGLASSRIVTLNVSNVNEAPSVPIGGAQTVTLNEGTSVASDIGITIIATDPDEGDEVKLTVNDDRFEVVYGKLRVKAGQKFDFETEPTVDLTITGTDKGGLTDTASVKVAITNVNEAPTVSIHGSQTLQLTEGTSAASDTGISVSATDPDADDIVIFSVSDDRFEIKDGKLWVKAGHTFDHETESSIDVTVAGTDKGGLTHTQAVTIQISDVPETPHPIVIGGSQTLTLNEGISVAGDIGFTVTARDPDAGDSVTFSTDDNRFEIIDGKLHVKARQRFDFESEPTINLTITAADSTGLSISESVSIEVTDVNENPTVAVGGSQTLRLAEGTSVDGDTGITVSASDPDADDSVSLSVSDDRFEIADGKLRVKAGQSFDFETEPKIELTLTGTDKGGLTDTQTVTINITNMNEDPIVTTGGSQSLQLDEGISVAGDTGITVSATDPDAGDSVTLFVNDDRFEITDGKLRVKAGKSFDFETEPKIELTITGTDKGGLTDTQAVTIKVTNVNEAPAVSIGGPQTLKLNEGISVAGDTGITVSASDPDVGDAITFSVSDNRFEIKNGKLHVKAEESFDFETEPNIELTITGTDEGGLNDSQSVIVNVSNVNEAPVVTTGGSQTLQLDEGTSVAGDTGITVSASDPDADDSVTLSVNDDRFEITDGKLRVQAGKSFDFETEPTIELTITGTDQGRLSESQKVTIRVTDRDEAPEMTVRGSQTLNIFEGLSPSGNTGFRVSARDPEGQHGVTFSVDDDRFEITNGHLRLKSAQKFDARIEPRLDVTITAVENGGLQQSTTQTVTLRVHDISGVVFVGTKERTEVSITASDLGTDRIAFDPTVTEIWHSRSGSDLVLEGFSQRAGEVVQKIMITGMSQPFSRSLLHNSSLPTLNKISGSNPTDEETITGDSRANAIVGDGGENILVGLSGPDRLFGGPDKDTADYTASTAGVRVDLATGRGSRGHAAGDRYNNVENATGSRFGDVLRGDAGPNVLKGGDGDDTLEGRAGPDELHGGKGDDTVTYANSDAGVTVTLNDDGDNTEATGGHAESDRLFKIENLIGSRYNDKLTGNKESNLFVGGGGADTINGRGGSDTASYYSSAYAVTVDLGAEGGRQTEGNRRSDAYGDTLSNIENIEGSRYNDTLTGDAGRNVISGGRGADTIDGKGGVDTAAYTGSSSAVTAVLNEKGEEGKSSKVSSRGDASGDILKNIEHLIGSRYNDVLTGNSENNRFVGGGGTNFYLKGGTIYRAGGDTYNGGGGVDTVSYYGAAHGVTVNLATGRGTGGRALGDRYNSIENIVGTAHDDHLTGDAGANLFNAAEGADYVDGGQGRDTISYRDSGAWVRVDLALAGVQTGGGQTTRNGRTIVNDARGDQLFNIENIIGSDFNDKLFGNAARNVFIDTDGADLMDGRGGIDTVSYVNSTGAVSVDLAAESATGGSATEGFQARTKFIQEISGKDLDGDGVVENDQLRNIEHVFGSRFADTLNGDSKNNLFLGGLGGDNIDGRRGVDTVSYITSTSGVVIDLSAAAGSRARGGDAQGDRLTSIESIEGSDFNDTLTNDSGFAGQSRILGQGGNDTIRGKSTINDLNGGSGNDTIYGGGVLSLITGGTGRDKLHGSSGIDIFRIFDVHAGDSVTTADLIHDFVQGRDKIFLPDTDRVSFKHQSVNDAGDSARDTVIYYGSKYFAVLVDVQLTLNADDFNARAQFGDNSLSIPEII